MKLDHLKHGDKITPTEPHICMTVGKVYEVRDDDGDLCITCDEHKKHYLDGNTDDDGTLIGLTQA